MPETILIVDDTPANLGVLVETLGAAGYRLMVAEDGEEALAQTTRTVPDLILLDVMMPGIDGFETCRRLKVDPRTRNVPVLFMTALSETTDKVKAFAAGGVDYITKPIEHEEALARVRTHLQLRQLQRELAEQLALKERFMRIASHDLRNPLFMIAMATRLARRDNAGPETLARHLAHVEEAATTMRRVIDTFLELRPPSDSGGTVDLPLVAGAVLKLHAPGAEAKHIGLTGCFGEAVPPVRGDAGLIYQAIANFVSNALKFTPPGGNVLVRTEPDQDYVRLEVRDSGPGVPPAERAQLFTEGAALTPRPTGGEESHGLGLSIVKHLVESQGGRVGAAFPGNGGSLFWFELPVARVGV